MKIQYIITETEIKDVKNRLEHLKQLVLLSRDAGEKEDNREFYLRAKGFEDALIMLGILKK